MDMRIVVRGADQRWLDQAHTGSVGMWLGERSYRLARWVPVETWH
jgi:hypothetical protein